MAQTPEIRTSQGSPFSVLNTTAAALRASLGSALTVANQPARQIRVSQGESLVTVNSRNSMKISQGNVLAVVKGRDQNFTMRAWTFTQDGHDFYVLHLGESGTLVYDCLTQQWMSWSSDTDPSGNWKANTGCQWNAVSNSLGNSDSVCGDNANGMLYYIDGTQSWDDTNGVDPNITQESFQRILTGGLPARGRGTTDCNFVFLTGSLGNPYTGASVLLRTSDDLGKTWTDNGYITIDPGNWTQDVTWFSLGSYGAPGRIFEVVDDGAFERIDSLDMK